MLDFIVLFLHLFSAIVFVGYVFVDAVILNKIKYQNELKKAYFKSSGIVYAISFLILLVSGITLAIKEFEFVNWMILFIKISLLIFMLLITAFSIYLIRIKNKKEHFLVKCSHLIALIICFLIVIFAKLLALM